MSEQLELNYQLLMECRSSLYRRFSFCLRLFWTSDPLYLSHVCPI